jgi:hypothetical protein
MSQRRAKRACRTESSRTDAPLVADDLADDALLWSHAVEHPKHGDAFDAVSKDGGEPRLAFVAVFGSLATFELRPPPTPHTPRTG